MKANNQLGVIINNSANINLPHVKGPEAQLTILHGYIPQDTVPRIVIVYLSELTTIVWNKANVHLQSVLIPQLLTWRHQQGAIILLA